MGSNLAGSLTAKLISWLTVFGAAALAGCGAQPTVHQAVVPEVELITSSSAPGIERRIERITGDIYRFHNNNHSSLFLVADAGVVLIDPLNVGAAEWVKGEIESLFGKPVTQILYSHGHQDHASGAAFFGDVDIIAHENIFEVIRPSANEPLPGRYAALDTNGSGLLSPDELTEGFAEHDADGNGVVTGAEAFAYFYKDVVPPTITFSEDVHTVEVGGKVIEMHHVGGNHASDMSYIFFPDEKLVFYVDVISLGDLPFGELPWYSLGDSNNTYETALAIDADIAVPSHGEIGTQDDVRALQKYMADLRAAVIAAIDAGQSLEDIQANLKLEEYADWGYYEQRLPQNIAGMYRAIIAEPQ